jgi:hypothetical protein
LLLLMLNFLALLPEFIISPNVNQCYRNLNCITSLETNFYSYSLREFLVRAEENVSTTKLHRTATKTSINCLFKILFEIKLNKLTDLLKWQSVIVAQFLFNKANVVMFFDMKWTRIQVIVCWFETHYILIILHSFS